MIDEIRKRYPNPGAHSGESNYCVGGAFCRYTHFPGFRFSSAAYPSVDALEEALRAQGVPEADVYAEAIIYYNDRSDFDQAWTVLGNALDMG